MKISELLNEAEGHDQLFTSCVKPHKERTEAPIMPKAKVRVPDINYTPGKEALEKAYDETEDFTKTHIPNQKD